MVAAITPKALSIVGMSAVNKVYDGTTAATLDITAASFNGMVAGDNLNLSAASGNFSDKNAGTGKTVSVTGLNIGGADAGNYVLAGTTAQASADITVRTLNVTALGQNKVYDGTTAAQLGYTDDRLVSDDLNITGTGSFADKNAGTGKTVSVTGLNIGGADAGNYVLVGTTAQASADIAKAKATVTANSINTSYNSQNQTASGFTATGLVNGEDESVLSGVAASVIAKNAGSYINTASGTDKNYDLTFVSGALDIAKAQIDHVTGILANNKFYDGNTAALLNTEHAEFVGIYAGDELNIATATGTFSDNTVGKEKIVSISNLRLGGVDAENYQLIDTTASTKADISILTPPVSPPTDIPMLNPARYLKAMQFRLNNDQVNKKPPVNTIINVVNGAVNMNGITMLAGEH
ncbi:hypothetical protein HLH10_15160 [Acinetobacter sp. ANC 4277]|uniref:YDG domain-containing protein n=1 Tax=Acinetobacter terrae TaxID=2731247 RepID=UPI00148FEB57|nr:YDG domain-containing protein [Acinetobacter terrae]NNG77568.1 hypothetical protein [Acinetobacter terrae]